MAILSGIQADKSCTPQVFKALCQLYASQEYDGLRIASGKVFLGQRLG
jgi:hypothetical protein